MISAILLTLAFPRTDVWALAWIALIPLLFALENKTPAAAFRTGYFCGVVFYGATLNWFINMSDSAGIPWFLAVLAVMAVVLYMSVYFGLFGFLFAYFRERPVMQKMFLFPSLWVGLEFIRDRLFTGFGWLSLGYSQYKILPLIQIADLTGVFGVSFLIVMVNYVLKEAISGRRVYREAGITAAVLIAVLSYGRLRLVEYSQAPKRTMTIAVVQPNVPQQIKWEPAVWPLTMKKMYKLTQEVLASGKQPDLIIWPETSYPGYMWDSPQLYEELKLFVAGLNTPLLFGAVKKVGEEYFNAAILLSAQGKPVQEYHKVHLVPFGEFIPLRNWLTWLVDLLGLADFTAGTEYTVFPLAQGGSINHFSVLICFEDTVARLAPRFVREGAELLVNMTNDAWFADSKEPFMHLQASVFRAVENRRGLVRAANTGVSCFIDKTGRIYNYLGGGGKKTFVTAMTVDQAGFERHLSLYTKLGDVFTYLCFGCILVLIITRKKD